MGKYQFNKYLQKGLAPLLAGLQFVAGYGIAEAVKPVQHEKRRIVYTETWLSNSKAQAFLEQIIGAIPESVLKISYAAHNPIPDEETGIRDNYAITVPVDSEKIGRGTASRVYVLEHTFESPEAKIQNGDGPRVILEPYREERKDAELELKLKVELVDYHFTLARFFKEGIPQYKTESFTDKEGKFNAELFLLIARALASYEKYRGLESMVRQGSLKDQNFDLTLAKLPVAIAYDSLSNSELTGKMDIDFIERLKKDIDPAVLFPKME